MENDKNITPNANLGINEIPPTKLDEVPPTSPKKFNLNNKNLIVIFLAALVVIILIVFALQTKKSTPQATSQIVPTTPPVADATMFLQLNQTQPSSVNVEINSPTHSITCAQFELSYDPKILSNFQITPGDFLKNPTLLPLGTPNPVNGLYPYAICTQPGGKPSNGIGTVAVVSYTINPAAHGQTTISFVGNSLLSASGVKPSVLKSTQNITISLSK